MKLQILWLTFTLNIIMDSQALVVFLAKQSMNKAEMTLRSSQRQLPEPWKSPVIVAGLIPKLGKITSAQTKWVMYITQYLLIMRSPLLEDPSSM